MAEFASKRDIENIVRLTVWGEIKAKTGEGARLKAIGTGWTQSDCAVINLGYGFNLPNNADAEVLLFACGADVNQTMALPCLPWKAQRVWRAGTGGVQNPSDPKTALEFNKTRTHLTGESLAVGQGGVLEIADGAIYIRGDCHIGGNLSVGGALSVSGKISAASIDSDDGAFGSLSSGGKSVKTEGGGREPSVDKPADMPDFKPDTD